ncbi:GTP 3',8-cyclase MoaA [Granulicella arctica]|uniref:GTP 3',8-cyclase n=1 Tax=Granulicella arctica TaxID=940613 RepID=A0A7Y9PHE5_9BACT|nr:GTP 3',8-cyclase MoaA [Granulicella arctica]NYF79188.1 cyclic pyranopterin phosphate synthase [Granulicella arctica]
MAASVSYIPASSSATVLEPEAPGRLRDSHGRAITDLRVSVTDRCNYKCVYCRTGNEGAQFTELPIADYLRMVRIFVSLGIEKIRLTGGEPLLRSGLVEMIEELARMRTAYSADGTPTEAGEPLDIALTTNGHLLADLAAPLKAAGLDRVTVSMDAVDPATFSAITRVPRSFDKVLAGVRTAQAAGLGPVKVNCVLLRGFNDNQIEAFAELSRRERVIVRFIEWMPLEEPSAGPDARSWKPETVVPMDEIVARLNDYRPLVPLAPNAASETARRFTFDDGLGEIGIIAPVSNPFCGHCSRVRLTSDGKIRTCLFSQSDHDLAGKMLRGATDADLAHYVRTIVYRKEARHHIGEPGFQKPSRNMVHIGG